MSPKMSQMSHLSVKKRQILSNNLSFLENRRLLKNRGQNKSNIVEYSQINKVKLHQI